MTTSSPTPAASSQPDIAAIIANLPAVQAPARPAALPIRQIVLPQPGQALDSPHTGTTYWVKYFVSQGHFSYVFKGIDDWDNDVAIKVLKPRGTLEDDLKAASEELERLLTLRHGKITHVQDAFFFQQAFYIITEMCGMTVGYYLDQPSNDAPAYALGVARCVLQALDFVHRNGMVYLDLHPDNVFFYWERNELQRDALSGPTFKIGDFGITKPLDRVTPTSTLAQWMLPPEVLDTSFGPLGKTIDVYHAGLLLLQVALGRRLQFTREQILDGEPRKMALTLNEPWCSAIEKTLRRHVAYRTQTVRDFYRDIAGS
jgi:serine/threonine protein kinase